MRAAVLGTNWGMVHVAALRANDVSVVTLVGRDENRVRDAAIEQGIPAYQCDVSGLGSMDLDLITVATPQATHGQVISQLPAGVPVICEKPAIGLSAPVDFDSTRSAPVWVNYAFPYLEVAQTAAGALPQLGTLRRAATYSRCGTGRDISPSEWFFEVAVHPLSWLLAQISDAEATTSTGEAIEPSRVTTPANAQTRVSANITVGDIPIVSTVDVGGYEGVSHRIEVIGDAGELVMEGCFSPGNPWTFEAPELRLSTRTRTRTRNLGEPESGMPDPWYLANERSFGHIISHLRGHGPPPKFPWARAQHLDHCLAASLRPIDLIDG